MNNTIQCINDILARLEKVYTYQVSIPDYWHEQAVRIILADWNYTGQRVERYKGFQWMSRQWWSLLNKENEPYNMEKTCVLGFEPKEAMHKEKKTNMFLSQKGVIYLQSPPAGLCDIQEAVKELSDQPMPELGPKMEQWITTMRFNEDMRQYLHDFRNTITAGQIPSVELSCLKQIRSQYPQQRSKSIADLENKIGTYIQNTTKEIQDDLLRMCTQMEQQVCRELG